MQRITKSSSSSTWSQFILPSLADNLILFCFYVQQGNKVIQTQRYDMISKKKDLKMKADIRVLRQLCEREPHCLLHTLRNLFLILTALAAAAVRKVLQNASHVKFTFPEIVRTQPLPWVGHCL